MPASSNRLSTKGLVIAGLIVALVLAGAVSYFASGAPDGLGKVAEETGIAKKEQDHALGEGPFAGYQTVGVEAGWLSGGIAGVIGVVVTFAVAGGLAVVLRRHGRAGTGTNTEAGARKP